MFSLEILMIILSINLSFFLAFSYDRELLITYNNAKKKVFCLVITQRTNFLIAL
jgi:hypothetical protein